MLNAWPVIFCLLVSLLSYRYGKWRRDRGSPVRAGEAVWIALITFAIGLPGLILPYVFASTPMTPSDRVTGILLFVAIGAVPLLAGICIAGALRLVRVYIAHARSTAAARATGNPWSYHRNEPGPQDSLER